MDLPIPIDVKQLAEKLGATLIGEDSLQVKGVNEIHKVRPGDLCFADVPKYFNKVLSSAATVVLLPNAADPPSGKAILVHPEPFLAYETVVNWFRAPQILHSTIDPSAIIHPTVVLEPHVIIGPNVVIGQETHIQSNTYIGSYTEIGRHVIIQAGTTIGTDAFYFKKSEEGFRKWTSCGKVVIKDQVYIGSNCTINKGVSGETYIGRGTKIDCQVHIGHGAVIGENCLIAGQVGIGGKAVLEDEVIVMGQAGIAQGVRIGKGAKIAAKSGVSKSLDGDRIYFGIPAEDIQKHHRRLAWLRKQVDR